MIKVTSAIQTISSFTWSASEQVYPFEKATDGSTLYCKEYNLGNLPNTGTSSTALGFSTEKIYHIYAFAKYLDDFVPLPLETADPYAVGWHPYSSNMVVQCLSSAWVNHVGTARVIYTK